VIPPVDDPEACRAWFEQLWVNVCRLRERYMLPVRTCWWENPIQLEALAALAEWVDRYDSGEWDDPPGKLALLYDLERVSGLLRDGNEPFYADRDRPTFDRFLNAIPDGKGDPDGPFQA
jgi:hypothetical protein